MHVHFLDPYQEGRSLLHRLDARVKLLLTVGFILVTALTPIGAWPLYILLFSLIIALQLISELGLGYVLKRSALALPFVLSAAPLLFTVQGESLITLPGLGWVISAQGLERFLSLSIKSWISVQAAILMSATATFPDLLQAMRALRVPRLLVVVFGLMWRYLFVLVDEALRLMRARLARSGESGLEGSKSGGSLVWRAQVTGRMAGSLFLRGFERADRIYTAMLSRGYDGEVRSFPLPPLSSADRLILILGGVVLILLLLLMILFR